MFTNMLCPVINTYFLGHNPAPGKQHYNTASSYSNSYSWLVPGLVLCAHLMAMAALQSPTEPLVVEMLPVPIQVSLVSAPQATPAKPVTPTPPEAKAEKPVKSKTVAKKLIQPPLKTPPLVHKMPVSKPVLAAKQPVSKAMMPAVAEIAAAIAEASVPAVAAPTTPKSSKAAEAAPSFQSPSFNAAYLHNPAPNYPSISRRLREEGKVLLRVQVSADGAADSVELQTGSGYTRLDQAALEAVKSWRFTPAKRNEQAISASVIVPVRFSLEG